MSESKSTRQPSQQIIDKVFSQLRLQTPEARAYFRQMAPEPPATPMRIVISSTSNPF